jgi:hypothetical protein
MSPLVGGTVASHMRPVKAPNTMQVTGEIGTRINTRIASARPN